MFHRRRKILLLRPHSSIAMSVEKKQVWRPMFEPEVFRKQISCTEESTCDNVGTFRRPALIQRPIVVRRPRNCVPLAHLVTPLIATTVY